MLASFWLHPFTIEIKETARRREARRRGGEEARTFSFRREFRNLPSMGSLLQPREKEREREREDETSRIGWIYEGVLYKSDPKQTKREEKMLHTIGMCRQGDRRQETGDRDREREREREGGRERERGRDHAQK